MATKTPQHILDAIVEAYLEGKTAAQACAPYSKEESVCLGELRRRGIAARKERPQCGGHNKTPQHILDAIVETYLSGATAEEAARPFGKSKSVCLKELKRRGIAARPKTNADETERMVRAYLEGATLEGASTLIGRSASLCSFELKKRGIPTRPRTEAETLDAMVYAYVNENKTAREAGEPFGITHKVCIRELRKRGIPIREYTAEQRAIKQSATRQGVSMQDWRGFVTPEWEKVVMSDEWAKWRMGLFERDRFTCGDCGRKGRELQAHHIFRKRPFPHLIFEPRNGITLCKECHAAIRGLEEQHAPRYLAKIGSTVAPLVWFEEWSERS